MTIFPETILAINLFECPSVQLRHHGPDPLWWAFAQMEGAVYHIVRVSGRSSTRFDRASRAVIASGFLNASEARESAFRWVDRHFPDATYQAETGQWWVRDEDGSVYLFSIEPNGASG